MKINKEAIISRVEHLVSYSAILSARGRYDEKAEAELTELYKKDPDAYEQGYKLAKEGFGL